MNKSRFMCVDIIRCLSFNKCPYGNPLCRPKRKEKEEK